MTMPRPTIRRMMIAVAVMAVVMYFVARARRREEFWRRSRLHVDASLALQEARVFQALSVPYRGRPLPRPNPALEAWHTRMARKYTDAYLDPFAAVEPDPPYPR